MTKGRTHAWLHTRVAALNLRRLLAMGLHLDHGRSHGHNPPTSGPAQRRLAATAAPSQALAPGQVLITDMGECAMGPRLRSLLARHRRAGRHGHVRGRAPWAGWAGSRRELGNGGPAVRA